MSYRTIFTATGVGFNDRDLEITARLCEEVEAHLSVLVVALAAPPPIGSAGSLALVWLEEHEENVKRLDARTAAVRPCSPVIHCQPTSAANMPNSAGVTT